MTPKKDKDQDQGQDGPEAEPAAEDTPAEDAPEAAPDGDAPEQAAQPGEEESGEKPGDESPVESEQGEPEEGKPEEGEAEQQDPEAQVADLNDKLLRALAETENIRRRAQRDKEDASKYAIANFAREMVSVGDNLRRAMDSVDAETRKKDAAVEQIMVGLEMTEREMLATFERFGIKTIDAMDQKFDHNFHEAMFEMDEPEKPHGTVVQVVETGYVLNDRLLRPAKVGVSKGGPKDNGDTETPLTEDDGTREGQAAYEAKGDKGEEPGSQLDEEL